ncbi:MoaD/ThiS family protein [Desulfobacula sp.]|uniref:MoaD/ThiS family protein n=1 Tax=Desulfobacula sp. TaxID=2593537 RepID=UPI00341837D3
MSIPRNDTFEDLLNALIRVHGETLASYLFEQDGKTLASHIMFMVNGRNIRFLNKEKTILQEGDQVTILLPAGGG